jgi:hypothetical protein
MYRKQGRTYIDKTGGVLCSLTSSIVSVGSILFDTEQEPADALLINVVLLTYELSVQCSSSKMIEVR